MREKTVMLNFRVSPDELARINKKREEIGIRSMGAYLRKMAMDGYCVNLDLSDVRRVSFLLGNCSNNLNQYAKPSWNWTQKRTIRQRRFRQTRVLRTFPMRW